MFCSEKKCFKSLTIDQSNNQYVLALPGHFLFLMAIHFWHSSYLSDTYLSSKKVASFIKQRYFFLYYMKRLFGATIFVTQIQQALKILLLLDWANFKSNIRSNLCLPYLSLFLEPHIMVDASVSFISLRQVYKGGGAVASKVAYYQRVIFNTIET